jgi:hypothetical protein
LSRFKVRGSEGGQDRSGPFSAVGDGGLATLAQSANIYGVAVDASGNVYIADAGSRRIRMVTDPGSSGIISTVAGDVASGYLDNMESNCCEKRLIRSK